ncbi:response regulator [Pelagicoccus mobilis]|uniref:Response regulator n=1 Tax=Pelagicoccus mobilis TaxID=415221 RepID=A0A934RVA3_9BACT|nr:response regulator [Pelagicoccus mobilis]MBK1877472.1 response regulator [Pelagicoccus mobilis]
MSKTIMTVDDSPSVRQMVGLTLSRLGHRVLEAADGRDGLAKLQASHVDLIITDLNMPNMDGITMIRHIRSSPKHKFMPILMLTTETQQEKKMEGKKAGATGWIVKPFTEEKLKSVLSKVLR